MRSLVLILLFTLLLISQINTIVDLDLWRHFKIGEYIVKNFNIPTVDIFSSGINRLSMLNFVIPGATFTFAPLSKNPPVAKFGLLEKAVTRYIEANSLGRHGR